MKHTETTATFLPVQAAHNTQQHTQWSLPLKASALLIALLSVSACGSTPGDRALSGGGIGAGTGAVGAAVLGADPLTGALIGGGIGAATGALTDKNDVNLGKPAWR